LTIILHCGQRGRSTRVPWLDGGRRFEEQADGRRRRGVAVAVVASLDGDVPAAAVVASLDGDVPAAAVEERVGRVDRVDVGREFPGGRARRKVRGRRRRERVAAVGRRRRRPRARARGVPTRRGGRAVVVRGRGDASARRRGRVSRGASGRRKIRDDDDDE
jgi:hypothetical protein